MKKFFTLIAAAMMALGVSAESYTPTVKMTYVNQSSADASYGEVTSASTGFNKFSNGTVGFGNTGWGVNFITYIEVDASGLPENATVTEAKLTATVSGPDRGHTFNIGYNTSAWSADLTYNTADKTATSLNSTLTTTAGRGSIGTKTGDFIITDAFKSSKKVTLLIWDTAAGGGTVSGVSASITYTTETTSSYYVVRELDANTQIDTITYIGNVVGTDVSASETDKAAVYVDGVKYVYVSGDNTIKVDEDDTKNYIHLTFKEADKIDYTIKSSLGSVLSVGTSYVGDAVNYAYPRYQELNGSLYQSSVNNKQYTNTFTPTAENSVAVVNYNASNIYNIVYCNDGEFIQGFEEVKTGNLPIRASNGAAGFTADDVKIVSLPAGKYKMVVGAFTSKTSQSDLNFTVGGNAYTASSSVNLSENTSPEFTLTNEKNDVVFLGSTSSVDAQLDYIYIQKTGEYKYFEMETNLPDTITVTLGEVEDYAKLNLSKYISVNTNADEYFPIIYYAVAEEGVDKKDAKYTRADSNKPLYEVITEPGAYYVFADVVAAYGELIVGKKSTDTIVVVFKEKEAEPAEEPGVKYSYTLTSDITALGTYAVTGGSIDLLSGSFETKNNLYGQKSGSAITAQVNMERKLKVNDCIKLTMFCSSSNKATGFDITKDGTTSLVYFQLPSGNNKANKYTVEYIVKESDVDLIGVDTFSIKRITAADNLYLTGVEVEVLEKKAPEFTVQPVGKNVKKYEYVKIPVKATGFPEPTYQWYVNGEPVDYDSELGIYIGEPKTYTVYVTATNSEGSTKSEEIELKALDDIMVIGNSFVVSPDMEVADGLSFIAENGEVTLLENGNFSVQAADATEAPAGYSAIISGTVNPTVNFNDNTATGVCYGVVPFKNGVFTFVGKFNAGKAINIMKFTYGVEAKGTAGSLQADVETEPVSFKVGETEYPSGSSFDANYNGPISFDVDNQHGYIIYASGSKIGMYGFYFTEATAVDGVSEAQESVKKEGKFIENGQIVILKAGKKFNAAGAQIK